MWVKSVDIEVGIQMVEGLIAMMGKSEQEKNKIREFLLSATDRDKDLSVKKALDIYEQKLRAN